MKSGFIAMIVPLMKGILGGAYYGWMGFLSGFIFCNGGLGSVKINSPTLTFTYGGGRVGMCVGAVLLLLSGPRRRLLYDH